MARPMSKAVVHAYVAATGSGSSNSSTSISSSSNSSSGERSWQPQGGATHIYVNIIFTNIEGALSLWDHRKLSYLTKCLLELLDRTARVSWGELLEKLQRAARPYRSSDLGRAAGKTAVSCSALQLEWAGASCWKNCSELKRLRHKRAQDFHMKRISAFIRNGWHLAAMGTNGNGATLPIGCPDHIGMERNELALEC